MDIRVKTILDFVQSKTGHEHSVIAGGAIRDEAFNLVPRDYDLHIPVSKEHPLEVLMDSLQKEFKVEFKTKDNLYPTSKKSKYQLPIRASDFLFEGKLIDLISKNYIPNDENFGKTLVEEFDYGINMAYYDGMTIDDSNKNYQNDIHRHFMTLVNLDSVSDLPRAMERYIKFRDKVIVEGIHIRWDCPTLKLSKPKKEKPEEGLKYQKIYEEDFVDIRADEYRLSLRTTSREIPRSWINEDPRIEPINQAIRRSMTDGNTATFNLVSEVPLDDNF